MITKLEPIIYVITGPMYSSKTKALLAQIDRHMHAGCNYQLFKPAIDNRYSQEEIVTHNKDKLKATVVQTSEEIIQKLDSDVNVVGIDEVQFFDSGIVKVCEKLRSMGKVVYAAGLNMDYKRTPFVFSDGKSNMGELLAVADIIEKRTAVCQHKINSDTCGAIARYTKKIAGSDNLVEVGSKGIYIATCLEHHS